MYFSRFARSFTNHNIKSTRNTFTTTSRTASNRFVRGRYFVFGVTTFAATLFVSTTTSTIASNFVAHAHDVVKTSKAPTQDFQKEVFKSDVLNIAVWQIPHDSKVEKGGEDTYFMSKDGSAFGVFDGVGGWAKFGVDPREYSYKLSSECKKAVDEEGIKEPLEILTKAYLSAKGIVGSTTACLVTINGDQLKAANIGDSGFFVVRGNELALFTKEQQFRFDFPYQLGSRDINKPSDADIITFKLEPLDVIVLMSDGVLDNLYPHQVRQLVSSNYSHSAQQIAKKISEEAYKVTKNKDAAVPYTDKAGGLGMFIERGGKADDITTMVVKYRFT